MMKKVLAVLITAVLLFSLTACGEGNTNTVNAVNVVKNGNYQGYNVGELIENYADVAAEIFDANVSVNWIIDNNSRNMFPDYIQSGYDQIVRTDLTMSNSYQKETMYLYWAVDTELELFRLVAGGTDAGGYPDINMVTSSEIEKFWEDAIYYYNNY